MDELPQFITSIIISKNLKMSKIIAANAKKHHKCPKIYGKVKNKSLL